MTNWCIKSYTYRAHDTSNFIFHYHNDIGVFIPNNFCPLCRGKTPKFIELQRSLVKINTWNYNKINTWRYNNEIAFCPIDPPKEETLVVYNIYSKKFTEQSNRKYIPKIEKLLQAF